jgi:hypothetical protein
MTKSYWIAAALAVAMSAPLSAYAESAAAPPVQFAAQPQRHPEQTAASASAGATLHVEPADRLVPVYALPPRPAGEVLIFGQPVTIR